MKATILAIWAVWLILVIIGCSFFGVYLTKDEVCTYEYTGELTFQTEEEYSDFKEVMGQKGLKWSRMDVLSSKPPIIARFEVVAPYGMDVPYGEKSKQSVWPVAIVTVLGIGVLIPLLIASLTVKE